jgi:hypothetical protein
LNSIFYIEIADIFPEFSRPQLCQIEHIIDQKIENFDGGSLNFDRLNLIIVELLNGFDNLRYRHQGEVSAQIFLHFITYLDLFHVLAVN